MKNSLIWFVALGLAVLAGGHSKGADATGPAGKATSPAHKAITNSVGMKLVLIPAGEFKMGSPEGEEDRCDDGGTDKGVGSL